MLNRERGKEDVRVAGRGGQPLEQCVCTGQKEGILYFTAIGQGWL